MAACSGFIAWEATGERTARSTLTSGAYSVHADWQFGPDGHPAKFSAQRYAATGKAFQLLDWWVEYTAQRTWDGITVGAACNVYWGYPAGPFHWLQLELASLSFG
jgi:hypothetical protein